MGEISPLTCHCTILCVPTSGRYPSFPGPPNCADNEIWLMGNPNWATINIHLNEVRVWLHVAHHYHSSLSVCACIHVHT